MSEAVEAMGTDGDLTDCPELAAWFDQIANDQPLALDDAVNFIREKRMRAAAAKEEAERWTLKSRAEARAAETMERRLLEFLVRTGQPRAETATGRVVSVVSVGGSLPVELAEGLDAASLPTQFARCKWEPNLPAIRAALEAGDALPFATLRPRGTRLSIK